MSITSSKSAVQKFQLGTTWSWTFTHSAIHHSQFFLTLAVRPLSTYIIKLDTANWGKKTLQGQKKLIQYNNYIEIATYQRTQVYMICVTPSS